MSLSQIEKGYKHFMLKEIFEQLQSVRDSMRKTSMSKQTISLGGIVEYETNF